LLLTFDFTKKTQNLKCFFDGLASKMAKNLHLCVGLALKEVFKRIFKPISKKEKAFTQRKKRGTQSYTEKRDL